MDDLISRQYVRYGESRIEQKTGQWLINSDGYYPYCSICKNEPQGRIMTDYCPNCGTKMKKSKKTKEVI